MTQPTIPQRAPYPANVEAAKTYHWCACGMSKTQPFCDGSHKGSSFTPVAYTPSLSGEVYFCGCKASKNAPLCDGSHKSL